MKPNLAHRRIISLFVILILLTLVPVEAIAATPTSGDSDSERLGSGRSYETGTSGSSSGFEVCEGGKITISLGEGIAPLEIPCGEDGTVSFTGFLLKFSLWLAVTIAIFLVILGGYTIMVSTGDPGKLKRGREIITNALVGLFLVSIAGFVLRFMGKLIGLG